MPTQTFRWEHASLPVIGHVAYVGGHGICTGTAFVGPMLQAAGLIRSWRRRRPRSSIVLVEVEVPALVAITPEDIIASGLEPIAPTSAPIAAPSPPGTRRSVWYWLRHPAVALEPDDDP